MKLFSAVATFMLLTACVFGDEPYPGEDYDKFILVRRAFDREGKPIIWESDEECEGAITVQIRAVAGEVMEIPVSCFENPQGAFAFSIPKGAYHVEISLEGRGSISNLYRTSSTRYGMFSRGKLTFH